MSEPLTTSAEGLVLSTKALLSLGARRITVVINTMVTAMLFLQMKETTASVLGRVLERVFPLLVRWARWHVLFF